MKKGEKLRKETNRAKTTNSFWLQVMQDYSINNIAPDQIAKKYINPRTRHNYSREHIYSILKRMNVL